MFEAAHQPSVQTPTMPLREPPVRLAPSQAERVLEQPKRRRILEIIKGDPGIKISRVCKDAQAGWGTVNYHLQVLRRAGLIVTRPIGRDCLLFSSDYPEQDLPATQALRRGRASHLAHAIAETPGASQKQLCTQIHMTRKIMRRYVELLADAGLVSERREAQYQRYYPNPTLLKHLKPAQTESTPSSAPTPPPGDPATTA